MRAIVTVVVPLFLATACVTGAPTPEELRARDLEREVQGIREQLRGTDRQMAQAFDAATRAVDGLGRLDCAALTAERATAVPKDRAALVRFRTDKPYALRGRFQTPKIVNGRAVHTAGCEVTSP